MQLHGFADESRRGNTYAVTVVTVPTDALDATRRAVGAVVQRGSRRTHLSAESAGRRRAILGHYVRIGPRVQAHVAVAAYERGDDQVPRDRCLAVVVSMCRDLDVARLTLDTRLPDRDRLDRRTIASALRDVTPYDLTTSTAVPGTSRCSAFPTRSAGPGAPEASGGGWWSRWSRR